MTATTACGPHCGHWDEMQELALLRADNQRLVDKLLEYVSERELAELLTRDGGDGRVYSTDRTDDAGLRALITAWADADDYDEPESDDAYYKAWFALRKAVGR